jgi:hypothetical protein
MLQGFSTAMAPSTLISFHPALSCQMNTGSTAAQHATHYKMLTFFILQGFLVSSP